VGAETILASIASPEDLKILDDESLSLLAGEIRTLLVETVSRTGGHWDSCVLSTRRRIA
jgi:1-deoxy-D-xylulose-5-phosphate synthase